MPQLAVFAALLVAMIVLFALASVSASLVYVLPIIVSISLLILFVATAEPADESDHPHTEDNWRHW